MDYKITEDDVEKVFNYLKIYHADKASKEYALAILEYMQNNIHELGLKDPNALEDLYTAFEHSKIND